MILKFLESASRDMKQICFKIIKRIILWKDKYETWKIKIAVIKLLPSYKMKSIRLMKIIQIK